MAGTVAILLESKTVISLNKNSKNSLEILQLPWKTPAPPGQCWDIMTQISVDTFHREGVFLIMDVVNMSSWVDYIQIPLVSVCAVTFCLRRSVNHPMIASYYQDRARQDRQGPRQGQAGRPR